MNKQKIDLKTKKVIDIFIKKIAEQYHFSGAILFGSRARQTHKIGSDLDLAILLQGVPGKFIAIKLAMDDIAYLVMLDTGIRIQLLPIWESEWKHPENYSNPRLLENIQREGIPL